MSVPYSFQRCCPKIGRKPQPVLAGRGILSPDIELNNYKCTAVVDWLEFSLETPGVHQAVNVHRLLNSELKVFGSNCTLHVTGPERKSGERGSSFILGIQQPDPWDVLC